MPPSSGWPTCGTYQLGPDAELSQRILNELAAAKACLMDPVAKAAYDQQLADEEWQAQLRTQAAWVPAPPPKPAAFHGKTRGLSWLSVLSALSLSALRSWPSLSIAADGHREHNPR